MPSGLLLPQELKKAIDCILVPLAKIYVVTHLFSLIYKILMLS